MFVGSHLLLDTVNAELRGVNLLGKRLHLAIQLCRPAKLTISALANPGGVAGEHPAVIYDVIPLCCRVMRHLLT